MPSATSNIARRNAGISPRPPLIQEIILKMYRDPIEEAGFDMMELSSKAATERVFDMCIFNAAREVYTNGGTLVVGSMGFVMDDAEGTIWWEYGGPGYRVHQFIKNRIGCTIKIGE